jgi:hypothetical protein
MVNKLNIKAYTSEIERYQGSITGNWQSGTGTSGDTGADLLSIGTNNDGKLIDSLILDLSALTVGATISIRLYQQVNGTEKCILDDDFIVGTDPAAIPVINSPFGISEDLRVEVQSDNPLDNGLAIGYEYTQEEK